MSYWKGLGVAAAIDLVWIIGCPFLATEPQLSPPVDLVAASSVEDSLMMHVQEQPDDVDAIEKIADVYADNGWWDAAIDPLARALQLDPSRRSLWSALDRAVENSGREKITDAELTRRAAAFVEAVEMRGAGC